MTQEQPELLPCPFCGSIPMVGRRDVECIDDECIASPGVACDTLVEAIAAWNRRAEVQRLSTVSAPAVPQGSSVSPHAIREVIQRLHDFNNDSFAVLRRLEKELQDALADQPALLAASPAFPAPQPSAEGEREAFEAWADANGYTLGRHSSGFYSMPRTDMTWQGWLARASISQDRVGAELGRVAMRFVDRAGDVHPGIDDAETICREFHEAMAAVLEKHMPAARAGKENKHGQ